MGGGGEGKIEQQIDRRTIFKNILPGTVVVVVVVVSHIQPIGCQPEKTTLHGDQSRSWSAEQGKKKKSGSAPPPHAGPSEKIKIKSRDASTCLGATQVGVTQVSVRLVSVQGFLRLVG